MEVLYSFSLLGDKLFCKHPTRGSAEVKKSPDGTFSVHPFFTLLRPQRDKKGTITHIFMDTSDLIHLKFVKMH
jgi:hypothetical protein